MPRGGERTGADRKVGSTSLFFVGVSGNEPTSDKQKAGKRHANRPNRIALCMWIHTTKRAQRNIPN